MDINDPAFALFPLFFEVVSAYGNVGLSLGHPSVSTSLSGQFTTFSKLIICVVMIRGRHRTLPYGIDRAIMLPSERLLPDETDISSARDSRHKSPGGANIDLNHQTVLWARRGSSNLTGTLPVNGQGADIGELEFGTS
ncbi:hypothetical protein V495_08352 [Pseudogymnoascus sp. VKM F-4514 (FW-929)]|nr:hypothetical protein V495_08352 [Pseudogymnoascus sp. VKM F-4514 (FW-929)]KFY66108.1 hypothetical protein V497_01121 [Pseudogymnoascus sp. VKM F-4516 (FW-969)]